MSSPERAIACSCCGQRFRAVRARSFLGFLEVQCPACPQPILAPLAYGYRTAYWVMLVLMTGPALTNLQDGVAGVPGLLAVVAVVALVRDSRIRKAISDSSAQPA
jgi:hypothetical protein